MLAVTRLASIRTYSLQFSGVTGLLADFPTDMLDIPTSLSIVAVGNGFRLHPMSLKALSCLLAWVSEKANNWVWAS